jgi:tetratricopeptide (TPR) repeat protein
MRVPHQNLFDRLSGRQLILTAVFLCCAVLFVLLITACSSAPKQQEPPRAAALEASKFAGYGNSFYTEARYEKAAEMYTLALNSYIRIDDQLGATICYNALGKTFLAQGHTEKAEQMFQAAASSLTTFRPVDEAEPKVKKAAAETYNNLGELAFRSERHSEALNWFEKGITLIANTEDSAETLAILLHNRGAVYRAQNQLEKARKEFEEALAINRKLDNLLEIASNHYMLGVIALQEHSLERAVDHAKRALEFDKLSENSVGIGHDLFLLGRSHIQMEETERGREYLQRACNIFAALELDREHEKVVEYLQGNNL